MVTKLIYRNEEEWDIAQKYLLGLGYTWERGDLWVTYAELAHSDNKTIGIVRDLIYYQLRDKEGAVPVSHLKTEALKKFKRLYDEVQSR